MEQFFGSASALADFEKMEKIQDKIKLMWGLPVAQVGDSTGIDQFVYQE